MKLNDAGEIFTGRQEKTAGIKFVPQINKAIEITFNYIKHSDKSKLRQFELNNFYWVLIEELKLLKIRTVLDVGCGEGFTLDRIKKAKVGEKFVGFDNSPAAINLGKELFPDLKLKIGNIYCLPLKDDSEDLVICTEVLEHLEKPEVALKELARVSKKYLALSVPNEPFFSIRNLLRGKHIRRFGRTPGHLNWWTSNGFRKFIGQEELTILKIRHPFPFTLLLAQKRG